MKNQDAKCTTKLLYAINLYVNGLNVEYRLYLSSRGPNPAFAALLMR